MLKLETQTVQSENFSITRYAPHDNKGVSTFEVRIRANHIPQSYNQMLDESLVKELQELMDYATNTLKTVAGE